MTTDLDWRTQESRDAEYATRPQAPVLVIGRDKRFLDVQPTASEAEEHLAQEHLAGGPTVDECDYYDGIARPLRPTVADDGTVALTVTAGDPQPDEVRRRVNEYLTWALEHYDPAQISDEDWVSDTDLEPVPDDYSFPRFVDALDQRFNPGPGGRRHVGGRLHNFWHAISG